MKLDMLCNQVYVVASNEARMQSHEYLTPEHFLYAALMFDVGKDTLERSGGNISEIKGDLLGYFDEFIPRNMTATPVDSFNFVQMFEIASMQAHYSGRDVVTLGHIFSAMFNLHEAFAAYILLKNGVNRLSLLRIISRPSESTAETGTKTQEFLKQYTVNLTNKAKNGLLDPIIGREQILERSVQVLLRRLKNNPIHVGEPGVGKTAIVEGLAQRIADKNVPEPLIDSQIFYVDMSALVAGTRYRGDFEERLINLMDALSNEKKPIIYIDEIHTVVGAGAVSGGSLDATTMLKPYLSKGEIRFIGSTTFEEYKKYFEKDRALSRRFQRLDVAETTVDESVRILQGLRKKYEDFHNVVYTDEVISVICELSAKYMRDRFLPDKALDVMDESGARARMNGHYKRVLTVKDIERTVADMAKIPEASVTAGETERLLKLADRIKANVYGQDEAVELTVSAIKSSRAGLNEPEKPVASLLFVGPTGVGKTEIAKQTAEGLGVKLLRFDMSEYQEKHSVARLIGSPPGYVGYEEGGLLTDAITKTPHCVLLLDEIEKAHPDIYNVLLQIMDYGQLTDSTGRKADFRNVLLIMTSNAGAKEITKRVIGFDEKRYHGDAIHREIERVFNPEFRNRLDGVAIFNHISETTALLIASKAVKSLGERLKARGVTVKATKRATNYIASKGLSELYGAREIIRVVENEVKRRLTDEVLFGGLKNGGTVTVDYKAGGIVFRIKAG